MNKTKHVLKLLHEATDRYAIRRSGSHATYYVDTLDAAIPVIKKFSDLDRVNVMDRNRNNSKIAFGSKKTVLSVLINICNKTSVI